MPILKPAVEPREEESVDAVVAALVSVVVFLLWLLPQLTATKQSAPKIIEASLFIFFENFKDENKG